jgi:hypothetical protein
VTAVGESVLTSRPEREPGFLLTSFALFGGMTLWAVHLAASIAFVPAACTHDLRWVLNVGTVVTAAAAAAAVVASRWLLGYVTPRGPANDRLRLLGELSTLWNLASLALILLEGYPAVVIGACRR